MPTNQALLDTLECYTDDLVDCFEEFVKKSLVFLSVMAGAIMVLLMYVLKVCTDRADPYAVPRTAAIPTPFLAPPNTVTQAANFDTATPRAQNRRMSNKHTQNNISTQSRSISAEETTSDFAFQKVNPRLNNKNTDNFQHHIKVERNASPKQENHNDRKINAITTNAKNEPRLNLRKTIEDSVIEDEYAHKTKEINDTAKKINDTSINTKVIKKSDSSSELPLNNKSKQTLNKNSGIPIKRESNFKYGRKSENIVDSDRENDSKKNPIRKQVTPRCCNKLTENEMHEMQKKDTKMWKKPNSSVHEPQSSKELMYFEDKKGSKIFSNFVVPERENDMVKRPHEIQDSSSARLSLTGLPTSQISSKKPMSLRRLSNTSLSESQRSCCSLCCRNDML